MTFKYHFGGMHDPLSLLSFGVHNVHTVHTSARDGELAN